MMKNRYLPQWLHRVACGVIVLGGDLGFTVLKYGLSRIHLTALTPQLTAADALPDALKAHQTPANIEG